MELQQEGVTAVGLGLCPMKKEKRQNSSDRRFKYLRGWFKYLVALGLESIQEGLNTLLAECREKHQLIGPRLDRVQHAAGDNKGSPGAT